jgi:flagellar P-ring protein precursor FlgI
MLGADEQVYAVAQGAVSVGGLYDEPNVSPIVKGQTTVGRIPGGALVEKEISVEIGAGGFLTIVLNQPDFTTATRVVYSILKSGMEAAAKDAATITVPLFSGVDVVSLIAKMENLTVIPDVSAKVVINERTGTIVIGDNVRIAPVAVTYGGFTINVGDLDYYKEESESLSRGLGRTTVKTQVKVSDPKHQLVAVEGGSSLGDLIKAVNAVGASPRDLIAIIQSIKEAGALSAELEII